MTPEHWSRLKFWFGEAMDAPPDEVERILREADAESPELAAELRTLLREHAQPTLRTNAVDAAVPTRPESASPPATVGPYRILRELGRGGAGIVYLAERQDDEFHQPVALKLLRYHQPDRSNDFLLTKERRALAQLRHPNIAILTDWGTTSDATPWLALEYVEGTPIDQYCKSLDGPQILTLFLQVCRAVQYAHQRLILHSDLKPANILVTSQGQVKLLDFGISRLLEDGVAQHTVDTRFTPGYASPEQIQGGVITAGSDVYSLALVLYELLAGTLPGVGPGQTITLQDLARRSAGEPPRPPGSRPGLAPERARFLQGDLDRIILHALDHDVQRRYPSVDLFLADLENFRAGFPISIRPPSLGYQARRLIGRHRLTSAVAAAALVGLLALSGVATWQALVARRQQMAAERRFRDLQSLAHTVIFDLHDSIRNLPGSTSARRTLVETATKYLDGLNREQLDDDALQMEIAAASFRIGYVQVGISTQSLGDTPAGITAFRNAARILDHQWRRHPADRKIGALRFAVLYTLILVIPDPAEGADLARRYVVEADAWRQRDPAGAPYQAAALLHQAAGRTLRSSGDLNGALQEFGTSADLFTKLVDLAVDRAITQMASSEVHKGQAWGDLSRTLALESAVLRDMARYTEADDFHRRANEAYLKANGSAPSDLDWRTNRAMDEGRLDDALRDAKTLFGSLDAIRNSDSANLTAQRDISQARRRLGIILSRKGDPNGTRELREAAETMSAVADRDPVYIANRFLQIATWNDYATATHSAEVFRRALDLIPSALQAAPSRADLIRERARAWAGLGEKAKSDADWAEFRRRSPQFLRPPEL